MTAKMNRKFAHPSEHLADSAAKHKRRTMKYQLKDKIMWAGLIKIDGFEKNFQEACAREMPDNLKTILVDITGRDYCGQLEFAKTEIIESDDFSPYAWNDYLKTKPPRAGIWRVEAETADCRHWLVGRTVGSDPTLWVQLPGSAKPWVPITTMKKLKKCRYRLWE